MTRLRIVASIIGISQLALGALYLFAPLWFIAWQGLAPMAPDAAYPLGMLAGRFLVYGVGMFLIARDPVRHAAWAWGMVVIQLVDLAVGGFYVAIGVVALANAALPMFDAALFAGALAWVLRGLVPAPRPA